MVVQNCVPQQRFLHVLTRNESMSVEYITDAPIEPLHHAICRRRLNIEPPCRFNIEPGRVANF